MDIRIIELLAERRRLRALEHWTRKALEGYQERAVHLVREYSYTHSPSTSSSITGSMMPPYRTCQC